MPTKFGLLFPASRFLLWGLWSVVGTGVTGRQDFGHAPPKRQEAGCFFPSSTVTCSVLLPTSYITTRSCQPEEAAEGKRRSCEERGRRPTRLRVPQGTYFHNPHHRVVSTVLGTLYRVHYHRMRAPHPPFLCLVPETLTAQCSRPPSGRGPP